MSKHQRKNFHTHQKWVFLIMSTHQIPIISYQLKIKNRNSSTNAQKLNTMQSSTNHQHYPNLTISKNPTIQNDLKKSTCPYTTNFHPNHTIFKNSQMS